MYFSFDILIFETLWRSKSFSTLEDYSIPDQTLVFWDISADFALTNFWSSNLRDKWMEYGSLKYESNPLIQYFVYARANFVHLGIFSQTAWFLTTPY